ncbi:LysR family transcriptional regulator [Burkholderia glumae]|uniref:LysR family transcriptional regulator n=1 Tax=Burkholderia glumae TaxID=337 RepID=UPI0002F623D3|nr:LysR family transcriptional regulator [Burkholderia glumae]MCM2491553.1 LysR family transcriptional regulator [Burkholderia glumae]MCM2542535.1 LysR family transcriptional regulator [Burkholderia glumae]PJO20179.1 LysR family transcriptional regulator [Burkholderia glumae AU6208]QHE10553.1 LysR family transcriptional regulator [Burkholderia glumae AU6208]
MDYFSAIRAFLCAAESGSFSKAAHRIAVKTSTVSRYVADLERDLGIALFNRSTRGLVLTEGGRLFREHALVVMSALDEARDATSSLNASPRGLLRVTMPRAFGLRHVIPHLPELAERYPEIDVDAVMTDTTLNLIDAGIDLAIRIGALPDSQLIARRLATHRRVACASPAYVERHGMPATPEALAGHATLRFPLVSDDRWWFIRRQARAGQAPQETGDAGDSPPGKARDVAVRLSGRLRVDDAEALRQLAIAGCGIALLPTWAIGSALRDGSLLHLLPDWDAQATRAASAIWAVYPPKKTVSSKVRAFIDFQAEVFARPGYWDF